MNALSGHWFCSFCNDVKFIHAPTDKSVSDIVETCLDCRNNSLKWVKHIPTRRGSVSAYDAIIGFRRMHAEVKR
jgi:hypothetical protein